MYIIYIYNIYMCNQPYKMGCPKIRDVPSNYCHQILGKMKCLTIGWNGVTIFRHIYIYICLHLVEICCTPKYAETYLKVLLFFVFFVNTRFGSSCLQHCWDRWSKPPCHGAIMGISTRTEKLRNSCGIWHPGLSIIWYIQMWGRWDIVGILWAAIIAKGVLNRI
jgi:hypothetical protein